MNIKPKRKGKKKATTGPKPTLDLGEKTLAAIRSIAKRQVTQPEAATNLKVSRATFNAFLNNNPLAMETWLEGKAEGKLDIRNMQWGLAEQEHWPAIQHMSKHYLGQHDKSEQKIDITDTRTTEQLESGIASVIRQIRETEAGNKPKSVLIEHSTEPVTELSPISETEDIPQ